MCSVTAVTLPFLLFLPLLYFAVLVQICSVTAVTLLYCQYCFLFLPVCCRQTSSVTAVTLLFLLLLPLLYSAALMQSLRFHCGDAAFSSVLFFPSSSVLLLDAFVVHPHFSYFSTFASKGR